MVADALVERWGLGRARSRFAGRIAEGRAVAGDGEAARVAVLCPQTYMNDAGRSVGPARGAYKLPLQRVLVVHDEIDLPFGDVRTRKGGGLAGHNGLKSLKRELGGTDFWRVRVGVGRPDSTDPEIVSAHVLGRFREDDERVGELVERACEHVESVLFAAAVDGVDEGATGAKRREGAQRRDEAKRRDGAKHGDGAKHRDGPTGDR
jgi:peptidyl-tRNA hydrolase, PTH1 family